MPKYVIKEYQKGYEKAQAAIGREVAQEWVWPYAYDLEDLLKLHDQPDFTPQTRLYCFLEDTMVGYTFFTIISSEQSDVPTANLEFPRMLHGHEQAAELLLKKAFVNLRGMGISKITGRVTTMCPADIELAERTGFTISDWGYKVYYSYRMNWGKINISSDPVEEVDPEFDLDECSLNAARWYKRSPEWCYSLLNLTKCQSFFLPS